MYNSEAPMRYRKKPVEIDALWWNGENLLEIEAFIGYSPERRGDALVIKTLEGEHIASQGDYVIRGVKGEYYPCKPDIFEATYERVE